MAEQVGRKDVDLTVRFAFLSLLADSREGGLGTMQAIFLVASQEVYY